LTIINKVLNGNFDTNSLAPWDSLNAVLDPSQSHTGYFCALLTGETTYSFISQTISVKPEQNFEFLCSLSHIAASPNVPNPQINIYVSYLDSNQQFINYGLIQKVLVGHLPGNSDGNQWLEIYKTTLLAPASAVQAVVLIETVPKAGTSSVLVDDVALLLIPAIPGCIEPPPSATRIVYVNKAGNDATADGSECFPFLTVTSAMASITDASPTNRYEISIGPGTFSEPLIHLKANVQLVGASTLLTRLDIPFDINDPTWNGNLNVDNRSGFADLALLQGPLDFDFTKNTSTPSTGRLFFVSVNISPTPVFTGNSTFLSQINIRDCQLFGGYTQNGSNVYMFASYVGGVPLPLPQPAITINSIVPYDTQVHLIGGGTDGDVIVNAPPGTVPIDPFDLLSFAIKGNLTINGVNARSRATVDSIPIRTRVTGSALIERLNDANGLGYLPGNPGDWAAPLPTTVQEALDRIAAKIAPV
jgi:hypothetical protein